MVSSSFNFNFPPPPPYSQNHASTANAPPAGLSTPHLSSPTASRQTSDAQPPPPPQSATRQSLPSISEALGVSDRPLPYTIQQSGPPSIAPGPSFFQTPTTSLADVHRRPNFAAGPTDLHHPPESHRQAELHRPAELSRPPFPQAPPQSPYMSRPPPPPPPSQGQGPGHGPPTPTSQAHSDGRTTYAPQISRLPSLHPIRTGNSPASTPRVLGYPSAPQPSPGYEPASHSAAGPPYSYSQYGPPTYQYPTSTSGPVYTPSTAAAPPPRYPQPQQAWPPGHDYHTHIDERGETVKRHLDIFELESSLNEVAEYSGKMLEFSREYGSRAHLNQRNGTNPESIPHLRTMDELLMKSEKLNTALLRIREVVEQQHASMEDQMKDPTRDAQMRSASEANGSYHLDKMENAGGFGNGEGKKRRGRAAPPGRCHSCNRAETPEWRRGPDGARTLCNACGLHYAKLTRKMGAESKAAIGTSNLRPKSLGPGA